MVKLHYKKKEIKVIWKFISRVNEVTRREREKVSKKQKWEEKKRTIEKLKWKNERILPLFFVFQNSTVWPLVNRVGWKQKQFGITERKKQGKTEKKNKEKQRDKLQQILHRDSEGWCSWNSFRSSCLFTVMFSIHSSVLKQRMWSELLLLMTFVPLLSPSSSFFPFLVPSPFLSILRVLRYCSFHYPNAIVILPSLSLSLRYPILNLSYLQLWILKSLLLSELTFCLLSLPSL